MQGKVIKFNLVGGICVLIIIISIIVVSIIYIPKLFSSKKDESKLENSSNSSIDNQKEQIVNQIQDEAEYKEIININGQDEEITMKKFVSDYGYSMKYDVNSFYINKEVKEVDMFSSLYSDTVYINVSYNNENFDEKISKLKNNKDKKSKEAGTLKYDIVLERLPNHKEVYCEVKERVDTYIYTMYIEKNVEGYYIVQVYCGSRIKDRVMPIIERMIESFDIV